MLARLIDPALRIGPDLKMVESAIQTAVASYDGVWSVYLSDINSGRSLSFNPCRMWSASEVKLYVGAQSWRRWKTERFRTARRSSPAEGHDLMEQQRGRGSSTQSSAAGATCRYGHGQRVGRIATVTRIPGRETYGNWNYLAVDCGHFLERVLAGTNVSPAASAHR